MIRAVDVGKSFVDAGRVVEVLRGVSLTVEAGTTCAVMGPSGSGKSTLLYCLAGLEPVDGGEVWLGGRDLTAMGRTELARLRRGEIGFVFQSYNLVPSLSAFDNVALPFRLRGERPPKHRVLEVLEGVGLAELSDRLPARLSGGEQQRVALARVIATAPAVVFADEPTGALDAAAARTVLELLAEIGASAERAVVMATHDPAVAAGCDRVVMLQAGTLRSDLDAPSVEEVAHELAALRQRDDGGW